MNRDTTAVKVDVYKSGHLFYPNGWYKETIVVDTDKVDLVKHLPFAMSFRSGAWSGLQLNLSTLISRPDGKKYRSVVEYLFKDRYKRGMHRKNAQILDYSSNNFKF